MECLIRIVFFSLYAASELLDTVCIIFHKHIFQAFMRLSIHANSRDMQGRFQAVSSSVTWYTQAENIFVIIL